MEPTYDPGEARDNRFSRARQLFPSAPDTPAVREPPSTRPFPYTERHLQCVWFDPRFRPADLRSSHGEVLAVDDPGTWNLEAGPDFLGAAVRVGPDRRRLEGDVEVHIAPAGWKQHGHAHDPRYQHVRIHVTYFPGAVPPDLLPPGALQIELQTPLRREPAFSFESIDVAAYPYAIRSPAPPCQQVLRGWDPDRKSAMLDAAGEERIRRKTERFRERMRDVGPEQALYEEVLAALGYKHNKVAFRQLAVHAPVERVRTDCAGPAEAYAVLAGVAGLLPKSPDPKWDPETRSVVRAWWDTWWKRRDAWEPVSLDPSLWRLHGLRPANHPRRRLMAAAALFFAEPSLPRRWEAVASAGSGPSLEAAAAALSDLHDPFWSHRLGLGSPRHGAPVALVGPDRVRAILVNVAVPYLAAMNTPLRSTLDDLPPEADNQLIRQTAHWLFGVDHPRSLYRTGLQRQGLLQVFHDFCLADRSHCAACRFPDLLRDYERRLHRPPPP